MDQETGVCFGSPVLSIMYIHIYLYIYFFKVKNSGELQELFARRGILTNLMLVVEQCRLVPEYLRHFAAHVGFSRRLSLNFAEMV